MRYPDGLPVKCQTCPGLRNDILHWNGLQIMADEILAENMDTTPQSVADSLCEAMIMTIGEKCDEQLSPDIDQDRLRAAELLQANNGMAFEMFSAMSGGIEHSVLSQAERCAGKGPLKARVKTTSGSIVVELCRVHVSTAQDEPGEKFCAPTTLRAEN